MTDDGYDEDFDEEEVWAVMTTETKKEAVTTNAPKAKRPNHRKDSSSPSSSSSSSSSTKTGTGSGSSRRKIISSGARMIPIRSNMGRSAALSIPEWSTIHRHGKGQGSESHTENDDDEDEDARDPPHEWLAKKMARSQISSSSVCEGAGRTLKGRDLSKVRNAVLIRTGFLE